MPPCTTKRVTTRNLKTKNNQNCQKIELHQSLTTKELKEKHSFRPIGGEKTGSQGRDDMWQGDGWQSGRSHICMRINCEEQLRNKADPVTQGSSMGK